MKIQINMFPVGYYHGHINILLKHQSEHVYQISKIDYNQNLNHTITQWFKSQFNINIQPSQIEFCPPYNQDNKLIIDTIIQIQLAQNNQFDDYFNEHQDFSFEDVNALINLTNKEKQGVQQIRKKIADNYHLRHLSAINELLPKEFTTKYLSTFLSQISNEFIKPNNIRRTFESELKFIKKDHSRPGNPKSIFKYENKKA